MNKTMDSLLKRIAPHEMKEFYEAPWDYDITSPISTEDEAVMRVRLKYGLTKCEKIVVIEIDLLTNRSRIYTSEVINA